MKDKIGRYLFAAFFLSCLLFPVGYIWKPFWYVIGALYIAMMAAAFWSYEPAPSTRRSGDSEPPGGWAADDGDE